MGSIIAEIMASIPSQERQKATIARKLYGWIDDPNCHQTIVDRVADAITKNLIDENEIAKIVVKVNAVEKKHGMKKSRGAMFTTEFRKLWKSHDLVFGGADSTCEARH